MIKNKVTSQQIKQPKCETSCSDCTNCNARSFKDTSSDAIWYWSTSVPVEQRIGCILAGNLIARGILKWQMNSIKN